MFPVLSALYALVLPIPAIAADQPPPAALPAAAEAASIPPMTETQKKALIIVMQDAACTGQRDVFLHAEQYKTAFSDNHHLLAYFLNLSCQGFLLSPEFANLPPEVQASLERLASIAARINKLYPSREQNRHEFARLASNGQKEQDFLQQYCMQAAAIDRYRENSRNAARLRFYCAEFFTRPDIRTLIASKAYSAKKRLASLINRAFNDAQYRLRHEPPVPARATPQEQEAIIRYIGRFYLAWNIALLEKPDEPVTFTDLETDALPQDLREQIARDRKSGRPYSPQTSRLILEKTGLSLDEHLSLLGSKFTCLMETMEPEAYRRLNLQPSDPEHLVSRLSLPKEQRMQLKNETTRLLLQDWQRNCIPQ